MTKFHVGQRVRVVRSSRGLSGVDDNSIVIADSLGRQGTIVGTESRPNAGFRKDGLFDVSLRLDSGELGMAPSVCLEPLTDSNDLVSWESMRDLWVPDHLRVKA